MYLNSAFRPSSGSSEASPAEGGTATAVVVPSSGSSKPGFYLSATLVLLGALSMSLIDLHKGRLRRRKKRALVHTRSIQVNNPSLHTGWGGHLFRRFGKMFSESSQAAGLYCSCHAAQAS